MYNTYHSGIPYHSLQAKKKNNVSFHRGSFVYMKTFELGRFSSVIPSVMSVKTWELSKWQNYSL